VASGDAIFATTITLVAATAEVDDRKRAPGEVVFTGDEDATIFAAFGLYSTDPGWFSAGYGAFRRLSGASGDLVDPKGRAARHLTLFREDAALTDCEAWLTSLYGQSIDPENPNRDEAARQLTGARAALNRLLPAEVQLVKLTSQGAIFGQARTGLSVSLRQLSDGYRSFLAMTIDLLRHTLRAGATVDAAGVVDCEGVVLIDEVDAHLHPRWQREIGPQLCAAFPKLQFIVSTHSPLIAQTAREGGLFRLVQTEAGATIAPFTERVLGRRVEQLLTSPLFGLASSLDKETEALVARRAALEARRPRSADEDVELEQVIHQLDARDGAPGPTWAEMKRQEQLEAELEALLRHGDGR
jgi:hypothetical protein